MKFACYGERQTQDARLVADQVCRQQIQISITWQAVLVIRQGNPNLTDGN
jgi:hypothetical protein